ncbi:MAG: YcxB family protein [Halioglobus sp.]|nr:YcxB family protein [Halioglobus sp.]
MCTGKGSVSERDLVRSQYLHLIPRGWWVAPLVLVLITPVVLFLYDDKALYAAGYLAFLIVYFFVLLPRRAQSIHRDYSALTREVTVSLRDDGVLWESEQTRALLTWPEIRRIKRDDELLLVYPSKHIYHVVPAHFFANREEFEDFGDAIRCKRHCDELTLGHAGL